MYMSQIERLSKENKVSIWSKAKSYKHEMAFLFSTGQSGPHTVKKVLYVHEYEDHFCILWVSLRNLEIRL